ncbi:MAG: hypothetical protein SFW67_12710 [Myxococcaceae bacterium]|nr:hypothetical protein [Myxococcaceae bacterium]
MPFIAQAPRPLVATGVGGGVEVTVGQLVDMGDGDIDLTLIVRNRTDDWARLVPQRLSLEVGPVRVPVEAAREADDEQGEGALGVPPRSEGMVIVRAPLQDATQLVLHFADALTLRRRGLLLPPVELLREGERFRSVRALWALPGGRRERALRRTFHPGLARLRRGRHSVEVAVSWPCEARGVHGASHPGVTRAFRSSERRTRRRGFGASGALVVVAMGATSGSQRRCA